MNWFDKIFSRLAEAEDVEKRDMTISPKLMQALMNGSFGGGVNVTPNGALSQTAVWASVKVLSESVAQIPLFLYERDGEYKVRATKHPLYKVLHRSPNELMSSFHLRQLMMVHLTTWGNAYCEIVWSRDGQIEALIPLRPDRVTPVLVDGKKYFDVELPDGTAVRLPAYRVWHVPGLGFDGLVGYSPIKLHANTVGLAMAAEEYGANFFKNGTSAGMVLQHPGQLSAEAASRLKRAIETSNAGLSNAHRVMVLEEGMDMKTLGLSPEDAQLLSTREFQVTEIARIFRVPPHMLGDMSRATWGNVEEMGEEFLRYTLMPYLKSFEATITQQLLVGDEQDTHFAEFLVDSFLRANTEKRYDAYSTAIQNGFMSVNEVRARENLNPIEGGDKHFVPLNLAPIGQRELEVEKEKRYSFAVAEEKGSLEFREDDDNFSSDRVLLADSFVPVFEDALARCLRRETKAVQKAFGQYMKQRNRLEFDAWLTEFYEEFKGVFERDLTPALMAQARQAFAAAMRELDKTDEKFTEDAFREFVREFLRVSAIGYVTQSKEDINTVLESDNVEQNFDEMITKWEDTRVEKNSRNLVFEGLNALVIFSYRTVGVREIVWIVNKGACPFCQKFAGKVVGIEEYFVEAGSIIDAIDVDGKAIQMKVHGAKRSGNLHSGCSCTIRAGNYRSVA